MQDLVTLSWRIYPAVALMLAGGALAVRGVRLCHRAWPQATGLMQPLPWMRGFRRSVIGLALLGLGAAWLWHLGWLCAVALIIGGGETLESSLDISAFVNEEPGRGSGPAGQASDG